MKCIKGGITYNTATATALCQGISLDQRFSYTLYQTRKGGYFCAWQLIYADNKLDKLPVLDPVSVPEAQALLARAGEPPPPPIKGPESRITLRLPSRLAQRVEAAAAQSSMSVNEYLMRCIEKSFN